jgi:two-component system cell cycle sensor histidine kinase/response regulator CckA
MATAENIVSMRARGLRDELNAIEERLARQRDALVDLTRLRPEDGDGWSRTEGRILEVSSAALGVERVSLWRFDPAHTRIECADLYEAGPGRHSSGAVLRAADYPAYFASMDSSDVVAADEAETDPRTREFAASYLRPLGISSMIDAPVHVNGANVGIICHEHVGRTRHWTSDEKSFVIAVSNLLALAMERCERSRAESTVALQAAALDAAADATLITDPTGQIVWTNAAFTGLTGYTREEAVGRRPRDLLRSGAHDQAYYDGIWATIRNRQVWRGELHNRRKDGSLYFEEQTITPVIGPSGEVSHFIAVKRDLTEKKKLEAQFLQAQKMEVVGQLASGVAHDFNNLLTVINGSAELALMDIDAEHPHYAALEQILQAGVRAATMTRQLLTFSRKGVIRQVPIDLGRLLTDFRGMLHRLIGENVRLEVRCDPGLPAIVGDPGQIEQVILNLAVNARDAMPHGGSLWIDVRAVALLDDFVATHVGTKPGPHVLLSIRDTGEGMSPEIISRIFEPFFTTKEPEKGTGLGLGTVYGIVGQLDGTIWVTSEPGVGTTFEIYLPGATPSAAS